MLITRPMMKAAEDWRSGSNGRFVHARELESQTLGPLLFSNRFGSNIVHAHELESRTLGHERSPDGRFWRGLHCDFEC
jgi:hypothetical protein